MSEKISIEFVTGNLAFEDSPTEEIALILERLAAKFREEGEMNGRQVKDTNGNTVGWVTIVEEE